VKIVQCIFMMGFLAAISAAFLSVPLRSWFVLAAACFASLLVACGFSRRGWGGRLSPGGSGREPASNSGDLRAASASTVKTAAGDQAGRRRAFNRCRRGDRLLETLLEELPGEHPMLEFRRGLTSEGDVASFDPHVFWEIGETLSGMVNSGRDEPGRFVIGVFEGSLSFTVDEARTLRPLRCGRFWILGLALEAAARRLDSRSYLDEILRQLSGYPMLDPTLRDQIVRDALLIDFLGKPVLVLTALPPGYPCRYGDHIPTRRVSASGQRPRFLEEGA